MTTKASIYRRNQFKKIAEERGLTLKQVERAYANYRFNKLSEAETPTDEVVAAADDANTKDDSNLDATSELEHEEKSGSSGSGEASISMGNPKKPIVMSVPLLGLLFKYIKSEIKDEIQMSRLLANLIAIQHNVGDGTIGEDEFDMVIDNVKTKELDYIKALAGIPLTVKKK